MPFPLLIPLIMAAAGGAAGAFGNRSATTTFGPNYTPEQQNLLNTILGGYQDSLNNIRSGDLVNSIINSTLSSITAKNKAAGQLIQNAMTARGLGRTTGGTSMIFNPVLQGMTEKAQFMGQVPQLRQNLLNQGLAQAGGFFNNLRTEQKQTTPGNVLGGLFSGIASGAGAGYGIYQQGKQNDILTQILKQRGQFPIPQISPTIPTNNTGFGPGYQDWENQ